MVKIATKFSSRALGQLPSRDAQTDGGGRDGGSEASFHGHGGGEHGSGTANFSRALDLTSATAAMTATAGGHAPVRPAAPASAPAPAASPAVNYTTEQAAALAPVQAAMERFVSRTQDSLAVTVRFEQGGSLSLKLSLSEGGIRTHIQTDVPGLESALRSAWDGFAQDWNQRGVKLGSLTFSPANPSSNSNGDLTGGRDQGGQYAADRQGAGGDHLPHGFSTLGQRRTGTAGARMTRGDAHDVEDAESVAPAIERSLPRGFRTWA